MLHAKPEYAPLNRSMLQVRRKWASDSRPEGPVAEPAAWVDQPAICALKGCDRMFQGSEWDAALAKHADSDAALDIHPDSFAAAVLRGQPRHL